MVFVVAGVVACGDNASPCDYTETADATNATIAETTNLTIRDGALHVCGALDINDADPVLRTLDQDTYRITVATTGPVLVQTFGDYGAALLDDMSVRVFDTAVNPTLLAEGHYAPKLADHGAFAANLAPGDYDVIVAASASGLLSAPIAYRIRIGPMPVCDPVDGVIDYVESHDGADNTGNDVVDVDFTKQPAFALTNAADAVEPTGLSIEAGQSYTLTGDVTAAARADEYLDRDTFAIATDETSNELAVSVAWDGTTSDLDFIVFDATTMMPIATSNVTSMTSPETATFSVQPSTSYWLWIGNFKGSAAAAYRATTCGDHFFE